MTTNPGDHANLDSRRGQPLVSVVVPCWNEQESLGALHQTLKHEIQARTDVRFEVIYVDDGSNDRTPEILAGLVNEDDCVTVVTLSRNFGQQAAISAGLEYASGAAVAVIDADLQDDPHVLPDMIACWREGADVVYAVRTKRSENLVVRAGYAAFYRLLQTLADVDIPLDSGDFGLMDRSVVDAINSLPERNRFVRGLRAWVGFHQVPFVYERRRRHAGRSKYSFRRLLKLAFSGLFDFSMRPLTIVFALGLVTSALSVAGFVFFLVHRLTGFHPLGYAPADVPGFTTLILSIFFLGGVQLLAIGILGEYIGRIYQEAKHRPGYIIKSVSPRTAAGRNKPAGRSLPNEKRADARMR